MPPEELALRVQWNGARFPVELPATASVADLKERLFHLTEVRPERQKILGLRGPAGPPADADALADCAPAQKLMLVGTREAELNAYIDALQAGAADSDDIVNDLDLYASVDEPHFGIRVLTPHQAWSKKLQRRVLDVSINLITPLRKGKRLLVLDLDQTLFDCRSVAPIDQLARPGLHPFLGSAYRDYDICIWSQTSWRWLEAKVTELGMLTHPDYRIAFVLDRTSMFSVRSSISTVKADGTRKTATRDHEVKPLQLIWTRFPDHFGPWNTLHVDDLRRNFALNVQSGLLIHPFSDAPRHSASDTELDALGRYLARIAQATDDFRTLDHRKWKENL